MTKKLVIKVWTLVSILVLLYACQTPFLFSKGQTVAFIGDSITQQGGYVEGVKAYLQKEHADLELKVVNLGLSSETVSGLSEPIHDPPRPLLFDRLDQILEEAQPDLVFFYYGINDGIYHPFSKANFIAYQEGVQRFLEEMQAQKIKVFLMTPSPIVLKEKDPNSLVGDDTYSYKNPYYLYDEEVMQVYRDYILSVEHPSVIQKIDIHRPLLEQKNIAYGDDPIHPIKEGHQIIAKTIIEAIEK